MKAKRWFCILLCLCAAYQASAHVLERDGDIGAIIHLDPDHEPVAGERNNIYIEFKDVRNLLDPRYVSGKFMILLGGAVLYGAELFADAEGLTAVHSFTFPKRGAYTIRVTGMSTGAAAFQPFVIDFPVRVERETSGVGDEGAGVFSGIVVPIALALLVIVVVIAVPKSRAGGRKDNPGNTGNPKNSKKTEGHIS